MRHFYEHTVQDIRSGADTWRVVVSASLFAFAASIAVALFSNL